MSSYNLLEDFHRLINYFPLEWRINCLMSGHLIIKVDHFATLNFSSCIHASKEYITNIELFKLSAFVIINVHHLFLLSVSSFLNIYDINVYIDPSATIIYLFFINS